jgi:eukaryotic-like serine/threonine-protein kinase
VPTPADNPSSREETLFAAVAELSVAARARYLEQHCGGDAALRRRVEALLAASEDAGDLLTSLPAGVAELGSALKAHDVRVAEKPGDRIGGYRLIEEIGSGGCGTVYLAGQEQPVRRQVALKVIKLGMDTRQVVARFELERQTLALMDHPNIAQVFEAGATDSGRPYFVMELVRGERITRFCDGQQLTTAERLGLFLQVCSAIQHAHQKGIIHRDLKPSNILVSEGGDAPVLKVIDFGIAKVTNQQRLADNTRFTAVDQFVGTPAYMSPEQAQLGGVDVDTRSDVYSLGVLLYELLTGTTPLDTEQLLQLGIDDLRKAVREQEPHTPSRRLTTLAQDRLGAVAVHHGTEAHRLVKALRGDLDWIVMKALEKDRTRRYESVGALAADIQRHLRNEPVLARPPSAAYLFHKLVRRHQAAFAGAAAVVAVLVIGIVASAWQAIRATRAEREQNRLRLEVQAGERIAKHNLARQYLIRGQSLCEQGDVARGLHWMARAHQAAPPQSLLLRGSIRDNLAAWAERWHRPDAVLLHDGYVTAGSLGPDGRRVATTTASLPGVVQFWSVESGEPLPFRVQHEQLVSILRFSPDGTRLFTVSGDRTGHLWDAREGGQLSPPLHHASEITAVAFSRDGSRIATGTDEGTVQVWDAGTGQPQGALRRHDSAIRAIAFSPVPDRLLTVADKSVRLWDAQTGEPAGEALPHTEVVRQAVFSADGQRIATACADNLVRLWNPVVSQPVGQPMLHPLVSEVAFSRDGERLLSRGEDQIARLWVVSTGELVGQAMTQEGKVDAAAFSAEGGLVLTAGRDGRLRRWSARTGAPLGPAMHHQKRLDIHTSSIVTTSNGWLVAGVGGHALPVHFIPAEPGDSARAAPSVSGSTAAFVANERRLLVGRYSGELGWWSPETGQFTGWEQRHDRVVYSVVVSADGRRALTASGDHTARLWALDDGERALLTLAHEGPVRAAAFSPDGALLATAGFDRTARLWSAETGRPVGPVLEHVNLVEDVAFSPDGGLLATACGDGGARLWSVKTGRQTGPVLSHNSAVLGLRFAPDGRRLVTASRDQTVRFWDVATGRPAGMVLEHPGWVEDLCFTDDGRRLATACSDRKIRIWSADTGVMVGPPLEFTEAAWQVAFSPDARHLAACSPSLVGLRPVPVRSGDDPPELELWVRSLTLQEMDEDGVLRWLDRASQRPR